MRVDKNQQLQADTQGDYSFGSSDFSGDSYLNFLLGFADSYSQLQSLNTEHWLNNTYSFYGQDNWHIAPRLTLNIGLRWDFLPHVYEKNNYVSNFVPADYNPAAAPVLDASGAICTAISAGCPAVSPDLVNYNGGTFYLNGMRLAGQNGFPRGIVQNDYKTLQPRVGFAWDVYGNGKTVLRAGGGMFYERIQGNDVYGAATNPPFAYHPSANAVYFSSPTTSAITGGTASTPTFPAGLQDLSYYYPDPATAQYSLGIQQQLAPAVVFVLQYVGSTGWNQSDERNINTLPISDIVHRQQVAAGLANANLYRQFLGYSNITQIESATNQNYNSFQTSFRWQNRHNLTMQFSYTWSHEIDIQSGDLGSTNISGSGGTVSNPFNLRYDRGSGVLDRRHIFNANYDYKLPFWVHSGNFLEHGVLGGWELSGVTTAESGSPINVTYSPDTLGFGGGTTNRPDLVGNGRTGPKTVTQWFNTGAFAAPLAPWNGGTNQGFGTAGKDAVIGPGLFNWNLALFKSVPFTGRENPHLELRVETFNTFNHTEFNSVDTGYTDGNFGQVTSTFDPREFQFGGKIVF